MSSVSVKSRFGGWFCGCQAQMVMYQCNNGANKGRLFWRCPYWKNADTCNLFIWAEDVGEKSGNEDLTIRNSEFDVMESVGYMKSLYEDARKKNKNLKAKLKILEYHGKIKMLVLVVSCMINLYFVFKCNY